MIDNLNLLAYQSGLVSTPLQEQAAAAAKDLCQEQQLMRIGDPLPLVFCRRIGDLGGVLVSPPATEARFENDGNNVLTTKWHLVVSEGPIDPIQARDLFQCACRVGSGAQAFNHRAGTWEPGNFLTDPGEGFTPWEVPKSCGAAGTYDDLHTLSFTNTWQDGENYNQQIHAFIRGGRHVQRLVDNVLGPSCNVVDLYLLFLRKVERIPYNLIDLDNLRQAALFTESLGLRFDGKFGQDKTINLDDWCENVLKPYFLLARTRVNGREGLTPLLPINLNGTLRLTQVGYDVMLTEADLDLESWDLQFISLADRRPICAQMMWRQQSDGVASIVRTTEVRFSAPYDAPNGPFEQHDLSEFACSETHIAKVGAYQVAHRGLVTHTVSVNAIPNNNTRLVQDGSIIRVLIPRVVDGQQPATHDYLYRVVSIERSLMGDTVFKLVHFPVDDQGRSSLAIAVNSAQPGGLLLDIPAPIVSCDENDPFDDSLLPDEWTDWTLPPSDMYDISVPYPSLNPPPPPPQEYPTEEPPPDDVDPGPDPLNQPLPEPPPPSLPSHFYSTRTFTVNFWSESGIQIGNWLEGSKIFGQTSPIYTNPSTQNSTPTPVEGNKINFNVSFQYKTDAAPYIEKVYYQNWNTEWYDVGPYPDGFHRGTMINGIYNRWDILGEFNNIGGAFKMIKTKLLKRAPKTATSKYLKYSLFLSHNEAKLNRKTYYYFFSKTNQGSLGILRNYSVTAEDLLNYPETTLTGEFEAFYMVYAPQDKTTELVQWDGVFDGYNNWSGTFEPPLPEDFYSIYDETMPWGPDNPTYPVTVIQSRTVSPVTYNVNQDVEIIILDAPAVLRAKITGSNGNSLTLGDTIIVTVTTTDPVAKVSNPADFQIQVGDYTQLAHYSAADSTSTSLVFKHVITSVVVSGPQTPGSDLDTSGGITAPAYAITAGAFKDADGNELDTTYTLVREGSNSITVTPP